MIHAIEIETLSAREVLRIGRLTMDELDSWKDPKGPIEAAQGDIVIHVIRRSLHPQEISPPLADAMVAVNMGESKEHGTLQIILRSANGLVSEDSNGFSDPYVVFKYLQSASKQTLHFLPD